MNTISYWVENRHLIRRIAFIWVATLTTYALFWSTGFASSSPRPGLEVAAILGAIWGPLTLLQGFVFSAYNVARAEASTAVTITDTQTRTVDMPKKEAP